MFFGGIHVFYVALLVIHVIHAIHACMFLFLLETRLVTLLSEKVFSFSVIAHSSTVLYTLIFLMPLTAFIFSWVAIVPIDFSFFSLL